MEECTATVRAESKIHYFGGLLRGARKGRSASSHYLFEDRLGRPGKSDDKSKVEGLVGYARRKLGHHRAGA